MNATKHTPGPWRFTCHNGGQFLGDVEGSLCGGTIRTIACVLPFAGPTESDANARLIAAAPDLLAALNGILDHDGSRGTYDSWNLFIWRESAERAITKATETKEND